MAQLKVFLFDECDYIAAMSKEESIEFYKKNVTDFDESEEPQIEEIEEAEWAGIVVNFPIDEDSEEVTYEEKSILDLINECTASEIEVPYWIVSIEM